MPMIDLTLPRNVLKENEAAKLISQLTDILLRWEGADTSNKAAQSIAWGVVNFADVFTVGAVAAAQPVYRLTITVPQYSLTDEIKAGVVQELTQAVLAREGSPMDARNAARVWCIINEVGDGNWGGAGRIFRLEDIGALVLGTPEAGLAYANSRKRSAQQAQALLV